MKLVVGLGNPETKYNNTRHNVGFFVLDSYLENVNWKQKFQSFYYETKINEETVIFIKPTTYMNASGDAIVKFSDYYDIDATDILIIHDDIDLPFGKLRIKFDSGSGGHNGIKSIIDNLHTTKFYQFKIGVSSIEKNDVKDFVIGKFNKDELEILRKNVSNYNEIIDLFLKNDILSAMSKFN